MEPAGTVRMPGCVGSRKGARGAKVSCETIDGMIPMNPCPPPPRFVGTELAFVFICNSTFGRISNVDSPWSNVSSLYSKQRYFMLTDIDTIVLR